MRAPRHLAALAAIAVLALAACGDDGPAAGTPTAPTTVADTTGDASATTADTSDTSGTSAPATSSPATDATTETTGAAATSDDLAAELDGRTFLSTSVEGYELVDGSQVQLTFDGADIGASAGCNQLASGWSLEGDVLVVPAMAMTQMACEPAALMDQDTWLSAVLTSGPTVALDGDTLTLTADGAVIVLEDQESADPDRPLEGTTWNVEGLITEDAVSSLPAGGRVPTVLLEDGTVTVDTGCNTGSGSYELGDGEITFGAIATTRAACTDPAATEAEQIVLATLTGTSTYEIVADALTLQTGADGLMLRAPADDAGATGLEGITWTLDSTVENTADANTVTAVPALDRPATLSFEEGTVTVDSGCNTGSGSYEATADEITFGPLISTLIACEDPAGSVEQAVFGVLTGTVAYTIADNTLTLMNGDQGLMYVGG